VVTARLVAAELSRRYGDAVVVDRLTLAVEAGEVFCLLGPNGAGKTTTINLFLNFVQPTSGVALVCGLDVTKFPLETKRSIAYISEQVALYGNLTGLENLRFFGTLAGHRDHTDAELDRLFEEVGLTAEVARRPVRTYSKGMRQKVGIAIALAKRAEVLLLDEPTAGLDPTAANDFSKLLSKVSAGGAAVLMTTHDLFRAKASEIAHGDLEQRYLELAAG
jgi:ABC-2 type transport system ATP-binding protein